VTLPHSLPQQAVRNRVLLQSNTQVSDARLTSEALQNQLTEKEDAKDTLVLSKVPVKFVQKLSKNNTGTNNGQPKTYLQQLKTLSEVPIPHGNDLMALLGLIVPMRIAQPYPGTSEVVEEAQKDSLFRAYPVTSCLIFKGIQIFIVLIFACLYEAFGFRGKAASVDVPDAASSEGDASQTFVHHLCDCSECGRDFTICFCSFCCLDLRWAHTVSNLQLNPKLSFWQAVILITLFYPMDGKGTVSQIIFVVLSVLFLCTVVHYRQELRAKFNIEHHTLRTVVIDIFAWMCCSCCAAVQEARQLEHGRIMTNV